MIGNIEHIEMPNKPIVNKFNAYFFEKNRKLFASITYILYL